MENVSNLLSQNFIRDFNRWEQWLASLGYSNFVKVLNAKDYGIPQNRERVFMISILGDYHYDFPLQIKLKYRLKDLLSKNVSEKYYLDEDTIERISNWGGYEDPLKNAIDTTERERERERVIGTLTTHCGKDSNGMKLVKVFPNSIPIKNNTEKGYLEAKEGDGIDISSRMEKHRGNVQKNKTQTLLTSGNERGVVVKNE